jgi:Flp pilus assembly protein TadD
MTLQEYAATTRRWPVRACLLGLSVFLWCSCSPPSPSVSRSTARFGKPPAAEPQRDPPPSAKTLYSMAEILTTQGKDKECEFVLRRCMQDHPRFTPAYNSLAELQIRQGRIHEAVDTLSAALQVRPRDPVLLNNLGMCLLLRKEYVRALEHFTSAAGLVPENEKYRANMATALGLLGRQEESRALLQQILPRDKADANAEVLRKAHDKETDQTVDAPPA